MIRPKGPLEKGRQRTGRGPQGWASFPDGREAPGLIPEYESMEGHPSCPLPQTLGCSIPSYGNRKGGKWVWWPCHPTPGRWTGGSVHGQPGLHETASNNLQRKVYEGSSSDMGCAWEARRARSLRSLQRLPQGLLVHKILRPSL